jgi:IS5 family transposase
LCKAFDRISMSVCRVLLRQSAQLHDPSEHGAIDATFYDRSAASRHYCQRTSYRVQKLKVTKLVDTASQAVLDVHCSTNREGSDADLAEQIARRNAGDLRSLAADKTMKSSHSVNRCVTSASDRSSSTASSLPKTTLTTPESTNNATISAL